MDDELASVNSRRKSAPSADTCIPKIKLLDRKTTTDQVLTVDIAEQVRYCPAAHTFETLVTDAE